MPPKPKPAKGAPATGQAVEEDLSDVANLPQINDFIFINFYAFKYRKNRLNLEKSLFQEFFVSPEGETAELAKRNRVIQISDLLNQAKAKGYLTEDEISSLSTIEELRLRQALARSTNELLASITVPLRRQKAEALKAYEENAEKLTDEKEIEEAEKAFFDSNKKLDLTVWLKDFPRSAADFQELRRSGSQHQPEIEVVIHGAYLVEEEFKRDGDLDDDDNQDAFGKKDSTVNLNADDADRTREEIEFTKEDRIKAFNDLLFINKYARNCPEDSKMRLLAVQKLKFVGPDPPLDPPEDDEKAEEEVAQVDTKKGGKGAKEEVPVEVQKSEEQIAEEKMFIEFTAQFREMITQSENDIVEYKALIDPVHGIQKRPLWFKKGKSGQEETEKIRKEQEEKARRDKEAAEAEAKRLEEEAAAAQKSSAKGKKPTAKDNKQKEPSRAGLASSQSGQSRKSRQETANELKKAKKDALYSYDDRKQQWNFDSFKRVMDEMDSGSTSIGGIMAAMVYQIEEQNAKNRQKDNMGLGALERPQSVSLSNNSPDQGHISTFDQYSKHDYQQNSQITGIPPSQKDQFMNELDNLYNKMAIEQGVVQTDFKHVFDKNKVDRCLKDSPYQQLHNEQDLLGLQDKDFIFMNGNSQGTYEMSCLSQMELPGVNNRFKMPEKATRTQAERESDTAAILKYCPLDAHMSHRLILLSHFEEMMQSENPERTYQFKDRNCSEDMDASTFRQVLCKAMRMKPDINTMYYDKQDSILLAINFKNPPGRLLRRQWSYPMKTLPDFPVWRRFCRGEQISIEQPCIDIASQRAGMIRANQKYCFPCDDSVIRIDKYFVGSRRFGATLVSKDNLVFGIKEKQSDVDGKPEGQDEIMNMETRRSENRSAEFWMEFENKVRMHVSMFDKEEPDESSIPPMTNGSKIRASSAVRIQDSLYSQQVPNAEEEARSVAAGSANERNTVLSGARSDASPARKGSVAASQPGSQVDLGSKASVQAPDDDQETIDNIVNTSVPQTAERPQTAIVDDYEPDQGSSITFTFNEGLVVQIKPNGDVLQEIVKASGSADKKSTVIPNEVTDDEKEVSRMITRKGVVIKHLKNGNKILYYPDGTITKTDMRKGIWYTTNPTGVVRVRNLRQNFVKDEKRRLEIKEKVDPETNATVEVRDDGLLKIKYIDRRTLMIMPDHTQILITMSGPLEEGSETITTLIKQEGYAPVRIISNPVKAQAGTCIGLGGTDALMGRDNIMERSFGGVISEILLPDRSIVQTYLEKQELPGYNKFSKSLIHLVRRYDFSIIKVRQDGEVVVITANERAYLNDIGKQEEFGTHDYDYFFELFGVPSERRTGIYTCNLEQGRMWTEDEEGNFFMIYADGDSTEKLSVSFNLDQMVEGIDNKEPLSPRIPDGEYIEEECKFLPPPKTVAEPRLFHVTANGATEYLSEQQLEYLFRTMHKDDQITKSEKKINIHNENAISHHFMSKKTKFQPEQPLTLAVDSFPKLPQCLEMVNQTVSIPTEPVVSQFLWRKIIQYKPVSEADLEKFAKAVEQKHQLRESQAEMNQKLTIEPRVLPEERNQTQNRIMLRIARSRGIDVQTLLGEEYNQIKVDDKDQQRQKVLESLDDYFSPDRADDDTDHASDEQVCE